MYNISPERQAELLEYYQVMKNHITDVDKKYSLSYVPIEMDFPESLGLEPMEFEPMTEQQLLDIAQVKVSAKYTEKRRSVAASHNKELANLDNRISLLQSKRQIALDKATLEGQKAKDKVVRKFAGNGIFVSSVKNAYMAEENDYTQATANYDAELQAATEKRAALESVYSESVAGISQAESQEVQSVVTSLREKEEKNRIAIEKYNQSIEERENRYQASCVRAVQYAKQAEWERAISVSRLYAELGESGVERQKVAEKYTWCQQDLFGLHKAEAQFILNVDSFLTAHLGEYYTALEAWVDTALPN